jgi:K+-transporting ATPase ATPase C chain
MLRQLKVNLLLLVATLVVGSVLYPLLMLLVAGVIAPEGRLGSLVVEDGQVRGSTLVAQDFKGPEYFQPRPSAVKYDAAGSGGSNWGASNPKLRDRAARQIATQVRYSTGSKKGQPVGKDVEAWFAEKPDRAVKWADTYPTLAETWVAGDEKRKKQVDAWCEAHKVPAEKDTQEAAKAFFKAWAAANPGTWPEVSDSALSKVTQGQDIVETFFDSWLQARKTSDDLERVPADLVTASGSGLDPHITLKGARYQLDRVASAWAEKLHQPVADVRAKLEALLVAQASRPLGFLGEPLVNVLEVNRKITATLRGE